MITSIILMISILFSGIFFESWSIDSNNSGDVFNQEANLENQEFKDYFNIEYYKIDGVDPNLLSLDIYNAKSATAELMPVIIMIHGGGWSKGDKMDNKLNYPKSIFFRDQGFIYISINYRLASESNFPDYPEDVAASIDWVYRNISMHGGDRSKIWLMGHSAGAQLAALVSTDQTYLQKFSLSPENITGLILLDGVGYDIPLNILTENSIGSKEMFQKAFSTNLETQRKASPYHQIKDFNKLPPMLILYLNENDSSKNQSLNLYKKLQNSGNEAFAYPIYNSTHSYINAKFGEEDFQATALALGFLREYNN